MLKLGVQLHFTPALSKACHPHIEQRTKSNELVLYILFQPIEQQVLYLFLIPERERSVQTRKFRRIGDQLVFATLGPH